MIGDWLSRWRRRRPPYLIALTVTRDDDWVLGLSLRASLSYCDAVVLTDHRSGPRTAQLVAEIAREFPDRRIDVKRDDREEWMEADVRQEMLERGRALGGTHFVVADADEVPTANLLPRLRDLALEGPKASAVPLPMISPYHCDHEFRWDGKWGEDNRIPWSFADAPRLAWRSPDGYQLHWRMPRGTRLAPLSLDGLSMGGLFHLQFSSRARLQAKSAWYKMTETLRYPGKRTAAELNRMYDWTLAESQALRRYQVPAEWWAAYRERGWLSYYQPAQPPWQLAEVRRLWQQYGPAKFDGLYLHGLVAG